MATQPQYGMDIAEAIEIAQSCLDGTTTPLAASLSLIRLVDPSSPIWDEMQGAHGPLSAFYIAADEADRLFLGKGVEKWHPDVQEKKRAELADAEANAAPFVRAACRALIVQAGLSSNAVRKS